MRALLVAGVGPSVPALQVELATPDAFSGFQNPGNPVVSVFLHRVAVNAERRNAPRRRLPDGTTSRPLLPLELSFMVTPWARSTADEYTMAGLIMRTFYDRAELGPGDLQGDAWEAGDSVQLVLESLPLEDHYRIWDTVGLPYRLSFTYVARVVGIEPTRTEPVTPVTTGLLGR